MQFWFAECQISQPHHLQSECMRIEVHTCWTVAEVTIGAHIKSQFGYTNLSEQCRVRDYMSGVIGVEQLGNSTQNRHIYNANTMPVWYGNYLCGIASYVSDSDESSR